MENNPQKLLHRLKEKFIAWRPVATEWSPEAGDRDVRLRQWFRRYPQGLSFMVWTVLFVLSFGLGIGLKSAAHTVVTIGYADYRLMPAERLYDLNVLRERALENGATLPVQEKREYPACSLSSLDDVDPSS